MAAVVLLFSVATARAEVASIYGGSDGLCGHKTASGERLNCAAMTAAHRRLPFGTQLRVCHSGCVRFASTTAARGFEAETSTCHQQPPVLSACTRPATSRVCRFVKTSVSATLL